MARADRLTLVALGKGVDKDRIETSIGNLEHLANLLAHQPILPSTFQYPDVRPIIHTPFPHMLQDIRMGFDNDMSTRRRGGVLEQTINLLLACAEHWRCMAYDA
jgi:hypothetical protein